MGADGTHIMRFAGLFAFGTTAGLIKNWARACVPYGWNLITPAEVARVH